MRSNGSILPTVYTLKKYKCMRITGLDEQSTRKMEDLEDFLDACDGIYRVQKEVENWMGRQAVRCLWRGDEEWCEWLDGK